MNAEHPARFSPEVLDAVRRRLPLTGEVHVHDPFAGDGVRLGSMCDTAGATFSGTELEQPFIIDPRVRQGNSKNASTYPRRSYVLVTSPVYPNGIADHFVSTGVCSTCKGHGAVLVDPNAGPWEPCGKCGGKGERVIDRRTYRHALAAITGNADVELHPDNMGRWGYRGRGLSAPARAIYWALARTCVAHWSKHGRLALVNVSDFLAGDHREPVVEGWVMVLQAAGWTIDGVDEVHTRRARKGANGSKRVEAERLIVARPS